MKYKVRLDVDLVLEVPEGTTEDEFYELYHNIEGVELNAKTGNAGKINITDCVDTVVSIEEWKH